MEAARNIDEVEQQESLPLRDLFAKQHQAVNRLLALLYTEWELSENIIVEPEELEKHRAECAKVESDDSSLEDQIHLVIKRFGESQNTHTEVTVTITPENKKRLELISGLEQEVAHELNRQYGKNEKDASDNTENRLKQLTASGIESGELKLLFTPQQDNPGQTVLQTSDLLLKFPRKKRNLRIKAEEKDPLANKLHDQFVKVLNAYISQEEAVKTASIFSVVKKRERTSVGDQVEALLGEICQMRPVDPFLK